ncbi:hypothetical protein ISX56_33730, partial [Serratia ureilytica]|nr:hypothetical protein [Serratia ureilytica]
MLVILLLAAVLWWFFGRGNPNALFFGLVAPPLGGVLMFLLMAFGSGEWVGISLLDAGDLLGMAGFIGIFSYALGFLPGLVVLGFGQALSMTPLLNLVLGLAQERQAGDGGGS